MLTFSVNLGVDLIFELCPLTISLRFEIWILDFLDAFFGQLLDQPSALLGDFFGDLHHHLDIFVPSPFPLEMRHAKAL